MEYAIIYIILMLTICFLSTVFTFKGKVKWIKKISIYAEVLNLLKVGTEIDCTSPDEKIHKNKR